MTPKKTAKAEPKFGEPVIPEGAVEYAEWDTTPAVNVVSNGTSNSIGFTVTKPFKAPSLVAYAPFDLDGVHYEPGDDFSPPASWVRDLAFDEFRSIERKNNSVRGMAFTVPGDIIDKKTGERAYSRKVLPLTLAPAPSAGEEA